jgi:hypothetical protein
VSRAALLEPPTPESLESAPRVREASPARTQGADKAEACPRPRTTPGDAYRTRNGEQPTLGDLVASAWEGLLTVGRAPCPVCQGAMELGGGAGHCADCGARLD